jgi:hypothetical protein
MEFSLNSYLNDHLDYLAVLSMNCDIKKKLFLTGCRNHLFALTIDDKNGAVIAKNTAARKRALKNTWRRLQFRKSNFVCF